MPFYETRDMAPQQTRSTPGRNKHMDSFFDSEALRIDLDTARAEAYRAHDAKKPVALDSGFVTFNAAAMHILANAVAKRVVELHKVSSERSDLQSNRLDRLEQRLSAATKEIAALRRQLGADV